MLYKINHVSLYVRIYVHYALGIYTILGGCLERIMRWLNFELDSAMEQTARVLSQFGNKDQPSKDFQTLIRQIGEAKTKHVSTL